VNHDQAVAALTATPQGWRKATYSQAANDCVEVKTEPVGVVGVRDSKNPAGSVLAFSTVAWATFLSGADRL
jgi:hypothetical protein